MADPRSSSTPLKPGGPGVVWSIAGGDDISLASDRLYATVRGLAPEEMHPELSP